MTDYKQEDVTGVQWQRANRIIIEVPYNANPATAVCEQTVLKLSDTNVIVQELGVTMNAPFDPNGSFPLRDPTTDALTGASSTEGALQMLLYSYVRNLQELRDHPPAP